MFHRALVSLMLLALSWPTGANADPLIQCGAPTQPEGEPAWLASMPAETDASITWDDVQIPSRDGTLLSARVYLPDGATEPLPTVLIQSPYHSIAGLYFKEAEDAGVWDADCMTPFLVKRGYAVVLGDMRGTHNSDGCFDFGGRGDQEDGYAIVQWIAAQSWSNGNVGMYGVSHVGMSQYAAAVASPPALKAIIPIAPVTSFYRYLYNGGVHYETNMATPPAYEYAVSAPPPTNVNDPNWITNVAATTCNTHEVLRGMSLRGDFDAYWRSRDYPSMASNIGAAVFHVHGTRDENVKTDHFTAIWSALEQAGVTRKALIGPWGHSEPAVRGWAYTALRWFEHHLRGNDTGIMDEPVVTAIGNDGVTRTSSTFPPAPGEVVLEATDGTLAQAATEGAASYTDIPGLPRHLIRPTVTARARYTSAPLGEPVRLSGTPVFDLLASIDQTDTNFAVHLFDVSEEGEQYVTRGYLDARHREALARGRDVEPGREERYRVELHARDYVFKAGHRIEVVLSSSDSCAWLVAVGQLPCASSGVVSDAVPATVTIHEGPGETALRLPVGPAEA